MLRVRSISAESRNYWALTVKHSEHCRGVDLHSDKYHLSTGVPIHDTGDDNRRQSNTVSDLSHKEASVSQSRSNGILSDKGVDHDTDNKVQGGVANLESEQGLREVLRVLHLRNEGEENDVASIREDLHGKIN